MAQNGSSRLEPGSPKGLGTLAPIPQGIRFVQLPWSPPSALHDDSLFSTPSLPLLLIVSRCAWKPSAGQDVASEGAFRPDETRDSLVLSWCIAHSLPPELSISRIVTESVQVSCCPDMRVCSRTSLGRTRERAQRSSTRFAYVERLAERPCRPNCPTARQPRRGRGTEYAEYAE